MKKIFSVVLVLGLILGATQLWASGISEKEQGQSEFKLISPKELVKELRDPNSERLGMWILLNKLLMNFEFINGEIYNKIEPSIKKEIESRTNLLSERYGVIIGSLIDQDFKLADLEKGLAEYRLGLKEIMILAQRQLDKYLDPSTPEYQEAFNRIKFSIERIEETDPTFDIKGLTKDDTNDYIRTDAVCEFLEFWNRKYFNKQYKRYINQGNEEGYFKEFDERAMSVIENLDTIYKMDLTINALLADGIADEGSEYKWFCKALRVLKSCSEEIIRIVETLPKLEDT